MGIKFINNEIGYASLQSGKLMQTTNSGLNWSLEFNTDVTTNEFFSSRTINIGDIIYYGSASNHNFYTRKLSTNFQTYFDNQSTPSLISFDGTQYASPSTRYLEEV